MFRSPYLSFLVLGGQVSCENGNWKYASLVRLGLANIQYDDKSASRGSAYLLSPSTSHDRILIGSALLHEDSQGCRHAPVE